MKGSRNASKAARSFGAVVFQRLVSKTVKCLAVARVTLELLIPAFRLQFLEPQGKGLELLCVEFGHSLDIRQTSIFWICRRP